MQLITMAMPKGDKCKQKFKNRQQSRRNIDSTDNLNALTDPSQSRRNIDSTDNLNALTDPSQNSNFSRDAIISQPAIDCPNPLCIDTSVGYTSHTHVNLTERASHPPVIPSVLGTSSADSVTPVLPTHSISLLSDISIESLIPQQHERLCSGTNNDGLITSDCPHVEDDSVSACTQNDTDFFSRHGVANIDSVKSESAQLEITSSTVPCLRSSSTQSPHDADSLTTSPLEVGCKTVDDNMNLTQPRHETVAHLQPQSLMSWLKLWPQTATQASPPQSIMSWLKLWPHAATQASPEKPHLDKRIVLQNCSEDNLEDCTSRGAFSSEERFFKVRGLQVCRLTDTECHSSLNCVQSENSSAEDSENDSASDFNPSHRDGLVQSGRSDHGLATWDRIHHGWWAKGDPPMWTSLALRENVIHCPEVVHATCPNPSCQMPVTDISLQHYSSIHDTSTDCSPQRRGAPLSRCDTSTYSGVVHNNVFQNGGLDSVGKVCRCDLEKAVNSGVGQDTYTELKNVSVTFSDLDDLNRMSQPTQIIRDMVLNHVTDDEVTAFMAHHENGVEELETCNVVETNNGGRRPSNPVACILDDGGNEHFLPILPNRSSDTSEVDEAD